MRLFLLPILLLCLAAVGSCQRGPAVQELYIISPHGVNIRREFETAFSQWHREKYGAEVRIHWPDLGGTSTINQYMQNVYEDHDNCGYDLMFGGGSAVFENMLNAKRKNGTPYPWIVPADLSADELAKIPHEVRGTKLRGKNDAWIGSTMSYFGITISKTRLRELNLPAPRAWEELAGPQWYGHLALADPSKSGSIMSSYEMILQQYGWEKGWPILVKMFANTPNVKDSGSAPAEEVGTENAAAGVGIDFFGRIQIAKQGADLVEFIVPESGSALDADPIAILRGAPHGELANHFMEFVLSESGQKLWVLKPGTPGGPIRSALGRMSILEDLYKTRAVDMTDSSNPFQGSSPLKIDRVVQSQRTIFLGDLVKSALIDNLDALHQARQAVLNAGDLPELLALFDALPISTDEISTVAKNYHGEQAKTELRLKWRSMAAALFDNIAHQAATKITHQ